MILQKKKLVAEKPEIFVMHLKLAFTYFLKPFDVLIGKQRDKVRQISML